MRVLSIVFAMLFAVSMTTARGADSTCTYLLICYDSYGDGWNGDGRVIILQDGDTVFSDGLQNGYKDYFIVHLVSGVLTEVFCNGGSCPLPTAKLRHR